jgi:esterase/lipase superfamily enzyme
MAQQILFATNRQRIADQPGKRADFGDTVLPQSANGLVCAVATVEGVKIDDAGSGKLTAISALQPGAFAEADLAPLLASTKDILIFVHGAANGFDDAITRAAYNQAWLKAANAAGGKSDFDIIVFTWPARSYFIANIIGDLVDYRHDQSQAQNSGYHLCRFLDLVQALRGRIGKRRLNLLCHSMGNYALGWAADWWFVHNPTPLVPLFNEVVLAAADETSTSFVTPHNGRLSSLWRLGHEITLYFNNHDLAMDLSHIANQDYRLGYDGPPNKADINFFSTNVYDFVDCSAIKDYIDPTAADRSHQYYRSSPIVRADIAAILAGQQPQRQYDDKHNVFSLGS